MSRQTQSRPTRYGHCIYRPLCLLALLWLSACTSREEPARTDTPTHRPVASPETAARRTAQRAAEPAHSAGPQQSPSRHDAKHRSAAEANPALWSGPADPALWPGAAPWPETNRENYHHQSDNPVRATVDHPVSTFSIDVDTASYSNVRRLLSQGTLPPTDAVRIEEMINYFNYDYPRPEPGAAFSVVAEVGPAPWRLERRLLHIGIRGASVAPEDLPPANLVFLVDVSGSMQSPDKLELLKAALKLLTAQLDASDRISIAVYAGSAGAVLEPTSGARRAEIHAAIDRLSAGGSTNGGAGIDLAYAMARQAYLPDGINRVILATDGDFNVGTTSEQALADLVARQRRSGVALTVLGFGGGNYNDALMQRLAQIGDGNAAYIDTLHEARKVLVDELAATLDIIARDVKIQVEFNPAVVSEYRLLGYQTRLLRREDFNDDRVDAGDIGAGHTVTALYEITLAGGGGRRLDPLRYGEGEPTEGVPATAVHAGELAFLRLRYKSPDATATHPEDRADRVGDHDPVGAHDGPAKRSVEPSVLIERPVLIAEMRQVVADTSADFRFSAAVAAFGGLLRGAAGSEGAEIDEFSYDEVLALAESARGPDSAGYRGEFLGLVRTARALDAGLARVVPDGRGPR